MMEDTNALLMELFVHKSTDRTRYHLFAEIAHYEGFCQIADTLRRIAHYDYHHARVISSMLENERVRYEAPFENSPHKDLGQILQWAAWDRNRLWCKIYPTIIESALNDKNHNIVTRLNMMATIEKRSEETLTTLCNQYKRGEIFKRTYKVMWRCKSCGFVHEDTSSPTVCALCAGKCHYATSTKMGENNY